MNTATATKSSTARYSIGQAVEVQAVDFSIAGFPTVWMTGTVTEVNPLTKGLFDVMVVTTAGLFKPQIVGKRGGNTNIREVS